MCIEGMGVAQGSGAPVTPHHCQEGRTGDTGVSIVPVAMTVSAALPWETSALNPVSAVSVDTGHLRQSWLHPIKVN